MTKQARQAKHMKSLILVAFAALFALIQLGCVVNGRWVELTPERAALHVEPPRKGEERFSIRRPAPEGVLILFENVANPPRDPDRFEIGVALVARESFGWAVQNSGTFASNSRHGMLISTMAPDGPDNTLVFYGKIVDGRVHRVLASFSSGQQMEETVVNGLDERVLICGHSHIPWKQNEDGRLVFNPGSVGGPINGDWQAQYSLLTWQREQRQVEHRAGPYDRAQTRADYASSGLLDRGAIARAFMLIGETGLNVTGYLAEHVQEIAAQTGSDGSFLSDSLWDQAVATFDWDKYSKQDHEGKE